MDEQTFRQLKMVGQTIPKELLKKAIIKDQPLREGVKEYLDWQKTTTRFLSKDDKKKVSEIKEFYDKGAFDHQSSRINPDIERKIEKHLDNKFAQLLKSGKITIPKLDPWAIRIMEKARIKK